MVGLWFYGVRYDGSIYSSVAVGILSSINSSIRILIPYSFHASHASCALEKIPRFSFAGESWLSVVTERT